AGGERAGGRETLVRMRVRQEQVEKPCGRRRPTDECLATQSAADGVTVQRQQSSRDLLRDEMSKVRHPSNVERRGDASASTVTVSGSPPKGSARRDARYHAM